MSDDKEDTEEAFDPKPLLDHARTLFVYHATQRLNSIRYFFAIYAVFVAGYIAVFRDTDIDDFKPFALFVIAALGAFVTAVYRALDLRNAELVQVDENAMHFMEKYMVDRLDETHFEDQQIHSAALYEDYPAQHIAKLYKGYEESNPKTEAPSNLHPALISSVMHWAPKKRPEEIKYRSWLGKSYETVLRVVFGVLFWISLIAALAPILPYAHDYVSQQAEQSTTDTDAKKD
ncbi:MAG: hypothetical protein AAF678_02050 [Pseudomonadota bacterium]